MSTKKGYLQTNDVLREEQIERLKRGWARFTSNALSIIGFLMVLSLVFSALFAPLIAPYPGDATGDINFDRASESPSVDHLMGTDTEGRDIFSRVLFGTRISLLMGAVVLSIAITVGVSLGLVAGYFGGKLNAVIMRTTDCFLAIPPTLLAMAVIAATTQSLWMTMLAIAASWWTWYARIIQGEVLSIKENEFIEASQSLGANWYHIAFKEILPNAIGPITVKATLDMGFVILVGAGLAFLGLGSQPPTPDWGIMIASGRAYVGQYWWMATFPGLAISYAVLAFNLLGDGLRDILDVEVQ